MTSKPLIMIVEDEAGIVDFLEMGLRAEGFDVRTEADGPSGLKAVESAAPALVILDLMLPGMDGIEVCRRIRSRSNVPVIMLTAKGDVDSRIDGFAVGADDYIPKPFRFEELLARIRAVLRRAGEAGPSGELTFGDLQLDHRSREVRRGSRKIELTAREFDLLALFLRQTRQVLSKDTILHRVWGPDFYGDPNVVEVYVRYLRVKLGEPGIIQTVRGVGYVMRDADDPRGRDD